MFCCKKYFAFTLALRIMRAVAEATCLKAGIAQLVEHNLAKVRVASSSLVSRSNLRRVNKAVM